jgi:FkbM family methyltransferase
VIRTKEYLRFKWSHHLPLHRLAVRTYNAVMRLVPFAIKYGVGKKLREKSPPYCLIEDGSVVVQVGAPQDTLHAGRSRGMYFSLFAGPKGKAIIVEPDADSIRQLDTVTKAKGIQNVILCHTAVWSERKMLRVFVNDAHPASNFTEGTKEYDARRLKDYRIVEVPADTIDNILAENGVEKVDLVSITTNGAEREILAGMRKTIEAGLPYISLARTGDHYVEMMESLGYKLSTHDDRGFTFKQERVLV